MKEMRMRPRYETIEDQSREVEALQRFANFVRGEFLTFPKEARLDSVFFRNGEAVAFVEVKCRNKWIDPYKVSKAKIDGGLAVCSRQMVPFYLLISVGDSLWYVQIPERYKYRIGRWGRDDRGDPKDKETCVYIPHSEFKEIP